MDDLEDLARRQGRAQNQLDPTYARPAPWFVGNSRALMIGVVSIVAVLLIVRVVMTWWLAEEVWTWAAPRLAAREVAGKLEPAPLPPAPVSSVKVSVAHAAAGNEAEWITADDYPEQSLRNGEEGLSRIGWQIDIDGRVRKCGVIESSGFARLDHAACDAIKRRARYRPALDADGHPIAITKSRGVRWVMPQD